MKLAKFRKYAVAVVVVLGFGVSWFWCDPFDADDADLFERPIKRSANLEADLKLMWVTSGQASTTEAVRAANRVFATVELGGLSRSEVMALLGAPRTSSDSRYSVGCYPSCRRDLVYCFNNGYGGGSQYNVKFDWRGKVRRVQFRGIE